MNMRQLSGNDRVSIGRWMAKLRRYNGLPAGRKAIIAFAVMRLPYRRLGHGKHRLVFDMSNGCVLKVPISLVGIRSNSLEYKLYTSRARSIKKYLCPVLGYGRGWLLMRRLGTKVPSGRKNMKRIRLLGLKLLRAGVMPRDMKRANLAMSRGKIIVVDYGHFRIRRRGLIKSAGRVVPKTPASNGNTSPLRPAAAPSPSPDRRIQEESGDFNTAHVSMLKADLLLDGIGASAGA